MRLVEKAGIEVGVGPKDTTGAIAAGQYVSMKGFNHLSIIIMQAAWAGGTPAVTLSQATAVAGTGAKSAPIDYYWQKLATAASTFAKTAVVSDTFNLPNQANTITVIELDAAKLDASNDFDCVKVAVASPGANADLIAILYVLSEPRYPQAAPEDAKID